MNSPRLIPWLERCLPTLERLASLEFDQSSHEQLFAGVGWRIVRESWYPECCFEIPFDDIQRTLVALYEDGQQEIGIGLYALTDPTERHEYVLESVADYHDAFNGVLDAMRQCLSLCPTTGIYHYLNDEIDYNYAAWDFDSATMFLIQHHEGDGHFGHVASLDIRVRPKTAPAVFPLVTSMLF